MEIISHGHIVRSNGSFRMNTYYTFGEESNDWASKALTYQPQSPSRIIPNEETPRERE